jgi:predicted CopG family antitoxin
VSRTQYRRTVTVRADVYDRLAAYCDDNGLSMSGVVEEVLEDLTSGRMPPPKRDWLVKS